MTALSKVTVSKQRLDLSLTALLGGQTVRQADALHIFQKAKLTTSEFSFIFLLCIVVNVLALPLTVVKDPPVAEVVFTK